MKKVITGFFSVIYLNCFSQFSLTVINGYGSGNYQAGDTVNVWSSAIPPDNVFDKWTGDIANFASSDEWHTTLIMPPQNVSITATFKSIGNYTVQHESIMGRDTLKEVYSYFPSGFKGVIFCFHGSDGRASNWVNLLEYSQFLNDMVADTFAFIITEAEEVSKQTDQNANGKLQWSYLPFDNTNVDFANIKALIDTFTQHGILDLITNFYAVGMSNGGAFAAAVASFNHWNAAVSYCAQSSQLLVSSTTVPIQWCMAKYDNHPNVGAQGNAEALSDFNTLLNRGICTKYLLHDRSPVYAERFMRSGNISSTKAGSLMAELQANHLLDANNYLLFASDSIAARIVASPGSYLQFLSLSQNDKIFMSTQIDAMYAAHQFYSDYNKQTLKFFDSLCDTTSPTTGMSDQTAATPQFEIFPNPAQHELYIKVDNGLALDEWKVVNVLGIEMFRGKMSSTTHTCYLQKLPAGIYFVCLGKFCRKLVIE